MEYEAPDKCGCSDRKERLAEAVALGILGLRRNAAAVLARIDDPLKRVCLEIEFDKIDRQMTKSALRILRRLG
jgi:hypothetical protein